MDAATYSIAFGYRVAETGVQVTNHTQDYRARVDGNVGETERRRNMLQRAVMRRQADREDNEAPPDNVLVDASHPGATELGPGRLRPAFVTELGPTELGPSELGPTEFGPVLSFKG